MLHLVLSIDISLIMGHTKIQGKDLKKINYVSDQSKSMAIDLMQRHYKHLPKVEKLELLEQVQLEPEAFVDHPYLFTLAQCFIQKIEKEKVVEQELTTQKSFRVFGKQHITPETILQMEMAMQLPVSRQGALMPDAHVGYGLPIGGVLATDNAVIPYAVGLDIGCRMALSIYKVPASFIDRYSYQIQLALKSETHFGVGTPSEAITEHAVLDRCEFKELPLLRQLHGKACRQLGSSGSGNHFVEFGVVELAPGNRFGLAAGHYVGLLSHSGSRGFGAAIAQEYTQVAMQACRLPRGAQHLAWLDLHQSSGQDYWLAMNLAGDYAKACHEVIHRKLSKALGIKAHFTIENHHNFAWKEFHEGQELVVHRKGATPAAAGQLGIIPANMIDPGYIVSGTGQSASLHSASHGAGRQLSRRKARTSITGSELKKRLKQHHVTLMGGGVDEAPMAYKNLDEVMGSQGDLVNVEGKFHPRIVRMDKY